MLRLYVSEITAMFFSVLFFGFLLSLNALDHYLAKNLKFELNYRCEIYLTAE